MKKKKILILGVILLLSIITGISFAYYIFRATQTGVNVFSTDCFKITFEDSNDINLINAIPMRDQDAMNLIPYTFTISNVCNHVINYNVNLEILNNTTIDINAVRVKLGNANSVNLGTINNNEQSVIVNENVLSSKTIKSGILKANATKSFDLRLFIDENATVGQAADKIFESKIVISTTLANDYKEGTLLAGQDFRYAISDIAGYNFEHILFSNTAPTESNTAVVVSTDDSDSPVYAWVDNQTVYLYSDNNVIFLNEDSSHMFSDFSNMQSLDLSRFDTSKVTDMSYMFYECAAIEELDLSNFDTSNVTNMASMFDGTYHLIALDLSNFDTSNVTNMSSMFNCHECDCAYTQINLSSFNTSKVTNMQDMFYSVPLEQIDLSSFDTSNVTDMSGMFGYSAFKTLDLTHFNTSKVTDMSGMFQNNSLNNIDLTHFDTSNVTNMSYMFAYSNYLTNLNLTSFDTSKVGNVSAIFNYSLIETVYVSEKWDNSRMTSYQYYGPIGQHLVGGAGTTYVNSNNNPTYLRIDCGVSRPGYLTYRGSIGDNAAYCTSIGY